MPSTQSNRTSPRPHAWTRWSKEKLLQTRICDLGLTVESSPLMPRIRQLYRELERRGLQFQPHVWLSDEWFCPNGIPGFAAPFFLGHPKLMQLEREFILEVEGGDQQWCMRLLRHETGHALANAYQLHQRRDWRAHFGRSSQTYPDVYLPKPYSKRYVLNLPNWYAQSHPDEDWAETFAVWLQPEYDWRRRYRNWPALRKLEYVDRLMEEIRDRAPRLRNRRREAPAEKLRMTLGQYYEDKVARYSTDSPEFFDRDLRRLFVSGAEYAECERASRYIRRVRQDIIGIVVRWTEEYRYRVNEVLNDMVKRCDELELRVARRDDEMKPDMVGCLTMLVMHKLYSGGFHVSL